MADNKKSFILYCDLIHTVSKMPNDKAGELFKHILDYVNDKNPSTEDLIIQLTFEPIKQQLKRDLLKWEAYMQKQVENGKRGGRPKAQPNPENPTLFLKTQPNPTEPKKADNVNDSVKVNVKVNVKENKTTKNVCEFFGITELGQAQIYFLIKAFVLNLENADLIQTFEKQFEAYKKYKNITGSKLHGVQSFIGSHELGFEDAKWKSQNWIHLLKNTNGHKEVDMDAVQGKNNDDKYLNQKI